MRTTDSVADVVVRYLDDDERTRLYAALLDREQEYRDKGERSNVDRRARKLFALPSLRNAAFTDHLRPAVILSLNAGLRRGELLALRWSGIQLDGLAPMITAQRGNAKTNKARRVPQNAEALETLKAWRPLAHPEYLFTNQVTGNPSVEYDAPWRLLLKRASITNFRWHDMRHDFASRPVMAGVDLNRVRTAGSHEPQDDAAICAPCAEASGRRGERAGTASPDCCYLHPVKRIQLSMLRGALSPATSRL